MTIERIRYLGNTYFYDPTKPNFYLFDKKDVCHVIIYTLHDYGGKEYTAEWRIPGTLNKDIIYARRMALKLPPWKVEKSVDNNSTLVYTNLINETGGSYEII